MFVAVFPPPMCVWFYAENSWIIVSVKIYFSYSLPPAAAAAMASRSNPRRLICQCFVAAPVDFSAIKSDYNVRGCSLLMRRPVVAPSLSHIVSIIKWNFRSYVSMILSDHFAVPPPIGMMLRFGDVDGLMRWCLHIAAPCVDPDPDYPMNTLRFLPLTASGFWYLMILKTKFVLDIMQLLL